MKMDVTTDCCEDIFRFLNDNEKEATEKKVDVEESKSTSESPVDDVWVTITNALDNWTQRIVDTETRQSKYTTFRQRIEESLERMHGDGLLNDYDIKELQYVADLWMQLLTTTSCYSVGCAFVKRDIITLLLELYSLKQVTSDLFIEVCLQL